MSLYTNLQVNYSSNQESVNKKRMKNDQEKAL